MSTPAIYAFICDRFGADALFMWKVKGPDSKVIISIECWMISTNGSCRKVLIAALVDGGFSVHPEIQIQNLDRLAMAVKELGEFESAYRGKPT